MMTTLLAGISILLIVYIAYILITAFIGDSSGEFYAQIHPAEATGPVETASAEAPVEVQARPEEAASEEEAAQVKQLRHPESGEAAAVPTNYRFAKRWIKEALVSEGLLDRVYKNNELQDEATNEQVKAALGHFKRLKKYWA
ncbi:hypothetical protein [Methylohalobius crimeensis]|uniref:hypothetical protein n=1 Tax=Methylohalobius crimeensis TaxID=244365 RepID=UPI0003B768B6|nr:hypothetical protein [Methylohalobius crimeensis]